MNQHLVMAVEAIDDKRGQQIAALNMEGISPIADYFVICHGNSEKQVQAIAHELKKNAQEMGIEIKRLEGYDQGRWVLLDIGDVVVHIFHKDERLYYNLEKLWGRCKPCRPWRGLDRMMKPGTTETLTVVRQAEFGFFLSDGEVDILLHEREVTGTIAVDETVTVFLYHDHQNRLSATMAQPIIKNDEMGWLEVVGVRPTHGVFVYNGISRDLFVSMDELPTDRNEWPAVGDKLFCSLTWDKKGRLMGKLVKGSPITSQASLADDSWLNQNVKGTIYHFLDEGAALFIENGPIAFLHQDEANGIPRLGQLVHGRVQFVRDDGRINITQRQLRTDQQKDDAGLILAFLEERKAGGMPYTDKSSPEDINARFGMSKAAFKRALGKLYKERKIEQRDGFTYLAEKK